MRWWQCRIINNYMRVVTFSGTLNTCLYTIITACLGNHLTDFDEKTWKLELFPEDYIRAKFYFDPTTWVVWANIQIVTVMLLCLLVTSSRAHVTPVDRFWRSIHHMTSFRVMMCLLGVALIYLPIYGVKSPKIPSHTRKALKLTYYR